MPSDRALALLLVTLATAGVVGAVNDNVATVAPGGIVVWPGSATTVCGQNEEQFAPASDGACYFPVDLLADAGEYKVWRQVGGRREQASFRVSDYPYDVERITLEDQGYVNLTAADLARVQRENAVIATLWTRRDGVLPALPLAPPLDALPAGGRFGSRRIINEQPRNPHSGADYAAAEGTPVRATAEGTVVLADNHFFAGNSVFIDHGDGLLSMYFHLATTLVQTGAVVARGQTIGTVGATGRATGPHLHFGLRWRGRRIDPTLLLAPPARLPQIVRASTP